MPPDFDVPSFPDELNGTVDYLVRSTDFQYKEGGLHPLSRRITQAGYTQQADGTYFKKTLPKLEFKYTDVHVDETVQEIDPRVSRIYRMASMAPVTNGSTWIARD